MATIKSYTDIKQSKKLAEILPLESADMYYIAKPDSTNSNMIPSDICIPRKTYLDGQAYGEFCAWSLAALLGVIPFPQLSKDKLGNGKAGWMVSAYPNDCRYDSCWHDNPLDACVTMVEKLHELNLL